jgi:hypothetical protein
MSFIAVAIGGGALIGAIGSGIAGSEQSSASKNAAQLQYQEQQNALDFQKQEWNTQQQNLAPWLKQGQSAIGTLGGLQNQALAGKGPLAPWTQQFQAPTIAQAEQEPGYQFALQQGTNALTNSAAASGNLLTGNTGEALQQYGQQLGQEDYSNVYNRALQQYQQSYNQYQNNQSNLFNRYAALSGIGQTAASQLGSEGTAAAGNVANISLTGGAQIGQQLNNAAAAQASGYVGAANSLSSGLNNLSQYSMLQNLINGQGGGGGGAGLPTDPATGMAVE